jgi:hypothetical protein
MTQGIRVNSAQCWRSMASEGSQTTHEIAKPYTNKPPRRPTFVNHTPLVEPVRLKKRDIGVQSKVHPRTDHEGQEGEQRDSTTLSLTSALDEGGWSTPRPCRFTPGKTQYPLYRKVSGPQGRFGQVRKISPHRDSIPGPSSPYRVAIPIALSRLPR